VAVAGESSDELLGFGAQGRERGAGNDGGGQGEAEASEGRVEG
jgi:hypothetical protein